MARGPYSSDDIHLHQDSTTAQEKSHERSNLNLGFFLKKSTLPPSIFTKVRFSSINSKTEQNTSLNF
jgi:hypothetical protein